MSARVSRPNGAPLKKTTHFNPSSSSGRRLLVRRHPVRTSGRRDPVWRPHPPAGRRAARGRAPRAAGVGRGRHGQRPAPPAASAAAARPARHRRRLLGARSGRSARVCGRVCAARGVVDRRDAGRGAGVLRHDVRAPFLVLVLLCNALPQLVCAVAGRAQPASARGVAHTQSPAPPCALPTPSFDAHTHNARSWTPSAASGGRAVPDAPPPRCAARGGRPARPAPAAGACRWADPAAGGGRRRRGALECELGGTDGGARRLRPPRAAHGCGARGRESGAVWVGSRPGETGGRPAVAARRREAPLDASPRAGDPCRPRSPPQASARGRGATRRATGASAATMTKATVVTRLPRCCRPACLSWTPRKR